MEVKCWRLHPILYLFFHVQWINVQKDTHIISINKVNFRSKTLTVTS